MDRLEEIRQRTEAATPGPWDAKTNCYPECNGEPWGWISGASWHITWSGSKGQINADFIAHSREDIPYLLSEVDRLTAALTESQRRERAAVEDLKLALIDETLDPCNCCEYGRTNRCTHPDGPTCGETGGKNWEWRGPQAEKGDAPNE